MKPFGRELSKAKSRGAIVHVWRRSLDRHRLSGVVLGFSDAFILLHVFDANIRFNGYSIVRRRDISAVDLNPSTEGHLKNGD